MAATTEILKANGSGVTVTRIPGALEFDDLWRYAEAAAQSKLFPKIQTAAQAFTLMMLCQSKGLHYMQALERYDIIEGKPGLKSIALAADFQARGGKYQVKELSDAVASAFFSHPERQPEPLLLTVKIGEFAHLRSKDNWKNYPRKMLWWRLISLAVDIIDPSIKAGLPAAEEIEDVFGERPAPALPSPDRPKHVEPLVWGQPEGGPAIDDRPYHQVARDAAEAFVQSLKTEGLSPGAFDAKTLHAHLVNAAVQQGLMEPPRDRKNPTVLTALSGLYQKHRDWVRGALNDHLDVFLEAARAAKQEAPEPAAPDPEDYGGAVVGGREREPGED